MIIKMYVFNMQIPLKIPNGFIRFEAGSKIILYRYAIAPECAEGTLSKIIKFLLKIEKGLQWGHLMLSGHPRVADLP